MSLKMFSLNNILLLLNIFISIVFGNSSPADLGTFSTSNDLTNSVTSFALPAEERMSVDSYWMAFINYTYIKDNQTIHEGGEYGKYGEGKILNVNGPLIYVSSKIDSNNHSGCDPNFNVTFSGHWIALIKRGHCNFEVKVKNAYDHGAVGVIIFNDRDSGTLDKMKIDDKERPITAVFTTRKRGEEMVHLLNQGYNLYANITEGTKCTKSIGNINRTSVLFVSISFIVLMIISLVWLVFYYVQRFRYLQTKDKQSRRLCNVAKRIIAKIPTKSIKSDDKEIDNDCCAICIEPYKVTDLIRVLPCKHEFHKNCLDPWLLEHRTCPMCKMDILKHYGFVFTGSQESILQLDMDAEDGDGDVSSSPRRDSVSPLPVIRSNENQLSRSISLDSDSDRDQSSPNERTPSLGNWNTLNNGTNKNDICVGCIAAALSKHNPHSQDVLDDDDNNDGETKLTDEQNGPSSLPSTLKKYKGNHSTGSCRGIKSTHNHQNHHNHHHHRHSHNMTTIIHHNEKEKEFKNRIVSSHSTDSKIDSERLLPIIVDCKNFKLLDCGKKMDKSNNRNDD